RAACPPLEGPAPRYRTGPRRMPPRFARADPSPGYERLAAQYRKMPGVGETHPKIPPDQTFAGKSLPPQADHIKRLIELTGASTLLDYGSGKGQQYRPLPFQSPDGQV